MNDISTAGEIIVIVCVAFQEERFCKRRGFVREVKREMCLEDMGSKIDVFFECEEWEDKHKKSNGIVVCLATWLRFSARGWIKAYE